MIQKIKQIIAEKPSRKTRLAAVIAIVLVSSLAFMIVVSAISVNKVTIHDASNTIKISTRKSDPAEILKQADISLGKGDLLDTSAFIKGKTSQLTIYRACGIKIVDSGITEVISACKNVGYTLEKNAIKLAPDDHISVSLDTPVVKGMSVTIERAFGITVSADSKTFNLQITPGTVADALKKAAIELGKVDETVPSLKAELSKGMKIKVLRVKYSKRVATEKVKYDRITELTKALYKGQSRISRAGVNGKKEVVYMDRFVNGKLDKTTVVSEKIAKKPVNMLLLIGCKPTKAVFKSGLSPISDLKPPSSLKLNAYGIPLNYKKVIKGSATAYSAGKYTASGMRTMPGHIAVDPRQFPYGTKLYVVTTDGKYIYGYCIAADSGAFVNYANGPTIDMYFSTYNECCRFGERAVNIYVLN
jgi:uncharacterized protein YabE (DUF348 family)/3D (Asp-Asp-Asp) domain-containing protein